MPSKPVPSKPLSGAVIIRNANGMELYRHNFETTAERRGKLNFLKRRYKQEMESGRYILSVLIYD